MKHVVMSMGKLQQTRYIGILWEISKARMSDQKGTFYGLGFYIWQKVFIIGVCVHNLDE